MMNLDPTIVLVMVAMMFGLFLVVVLLRSHDVDVKFGEKVRVRLRTKDAAVRADRPRRPPSPEL